MPFWAMGMAFCWIGAIHPILRTVASGNWPQVPCVITKSELNSHSDSDGTTYSIEIEFRYTYENFEYNGGRYDFNHVSSGGQDSKLEVIRRYPVGSQATCWVDPSDPTTAVFSRRIPGVVFFVIPFTSIFIVVGLAITLGSLGLVPRKWKERSPFVSRHKPVEDADEGERVLKRGTSGWAKVLAMLFVAVFWNCILGVFLTEVVEGFRRGDPDWFLTIFMIPFVLVGLGLIGAVVHSVLALSNPSLELLLSEVRPRLGQALQLSWKSSGVLRRLERLRIELEGREAATYRRGTDSVTDHACFHRTVLFETERADAHASGFVEFEIPKDSMHSFDGGNNKIEWRLRVRGPIRRWPDVDDVYPLTVRRLK